MDHILPLANEIKGEIKYEKRRNKGYIIGFVTPQKPNANLIGILPTGCRPEKTQEFFADTSKLISYPDEPRGLFKRYINILPNGSILLEITNAPIDEGEIIKIDTSYDLQ